MKFFLPFIVSFVLSVGLCWLVLFLARTRGWVKQERFSSAVDGNKRKIVRLGGMGVVVAFFITILLDRNLVITPDMWGLLAGALAILLFGLWDDVLGLSWKWQLVFQIGLAVVVYALGTRIEYITNPLGGVITFDTTTILSLSFVLGIVWFVLLFNAMNWLDGMDGLHGSIVVIAGVVLAWLSLRPEVDQPPVAIVALILAGAFLGFLVWNFPPARIFSGTVGSMFGAFALAYLSIYAGTKIATAVLVLLLPLLNALWVLWLRFLDGDSLFEPDRRHLHYQLLSIGWSVRQIVGVYILLTLTLAFLALSTQFLIKTLALGMVAFALMWVFWKVSRQSAEG